MRFSPVLYCCLGCALLVHARAAAIECEGMPLDARPSSPPAVSIQGRSSVSVPLRIPAGAEAFLFAREQGIDVSVVLRRPGRAGTVATDNPVRRTGVQRVRLAPVVDGQYTVEVTGKEHRNARGTVQLAVWIPGGAGSSQTCLHAQRAMAAGDEAFALGQSVSQGSAPSAATDAGAAYRKGRADYQRAVERFAADDTGTLRAHAEHSLTAILYQNVQDWTQAQAWAGRAASSYQASGDTYGRARAMALQAAATMEVALTPRTASSTTTAAPQSMSSLLARARSQLNDLAAFHASRGETYDQALALNNVGLAYYYEGLYDQAIEAYGSALRLQRGLGETTREAQILQNIALVESEIGRFSSAITRYEQVLGLLDRDEAARLYADVLNNSAMTRAATGDLDTALRQYGEAEEIYEQRQITRELARTLHGIGFVYYRLGDQQLALEYFERALALRSAALDARGRTASLRATASVLRELGRVEEGLALHREALELAGAPSMRARILVEIARDQLLLGRTAAASEAIESVLRQEVAGDEMVSAMARQQRGRLRAKLGSAVEAESDFLAAREVFVANDSPSDRFAVELDLAVLARERGRAKNALSAVDAALALAEEVRLQTSNPELRATLFQPLRPACDLKISLLAEQYFSQAPGSAAQRRELALGALAAAEQCRARALADFRALRSPTQAAAEQEARRQNLYRELATRRYQMEVRLDRSGPADPRVAAMRAEIASLRREIDTLNAGLGATRSSQARTDLRPRLETLGDDVAVIAYWIGKERSLAWVLTRESVELVQLAAPQEVNDAARRFHAALSSLSSASEDAR
ncbi:MAG TPA: tetratricopeptide repeat protein, partial [Steroidobacteraceae bacterium]|nr:tetratricopeptide repeat protein [Steroidobacteraceae bacterium]